MFCALHYPFFVFVALVASHSWVEQVVLVDIHGTTLDQPQGFIRGYVQRDATFQDLDDTYELPRPGRSDVDAEDLLCKETQRVWNYTILSPPLKATSGSIVRLSYNENGHVTKPYNDPLKSSAGRVLVYGTSHPKPDETLYHVHGTWTADGTGGDGRGNLLRETLFDDDKCYQFSTDSSIEAQRQSQSASEVPPGQSLLCQKYVRLPTIDTSVYTLYWVWDWPSIDGTRQIYTSCLDIEMIQ